MIKNSKQYRVTQSKQQQLSEALINLEKEFVAGDMLIDIEIASLKSQIADFDKDLKEYESLKKGHIYELELESFVKIPELITKAKIAKGWTHAELGVRLNVDAQQIQRYEVADYSTASFTRIIELLTVLDVELQPCKVTIKRLNFKKPIGIPNALKVSLQNRLDYNHSLLAFK
jgi:hypothetical protein